MDCITKKFLTGERAAYGASDVEFVGCTFTDGESPLKECRNIRVSNCHFGWKYPLWYCDNAVVHNCTWAEMGRSGLWYSRNVTIKDCQIDAPKQFRRCENLTVVNTAIPFAVETLWHCKNVTLHNVEVKGNYFGMNCEDVTLNNVRIDGDYCFDGAKNVVARNCVFNSKDSFWNCNNVVIYDSVIVGEYLAWNTKNITFVNCALESHQGLCYIDGLKLENCSINNSDLTFELCSDIDADIVTHVDSIKNPISGRIRCKGYGELIMDESVINPQKTEIEVVKDDV